MYKYTRVIEDLEQLPFDSLGTKGFRHDNYGTPDIWIKDIPRPTSGFDHNNWRMTYSQAICLPYNYGRPGDDRHLVITTRMHPSDPLNEKNLPVPGADPNGSLWQHKRGWGGAAIGSLWGDGRLIGTGSGAVGANGTTSDNVTNQPGAYDYVLHEERCTFPVPGRVFNAAKSQWEPPNANIHAAKSAGGVVPVTGWGWRRIVVDHICRNGQHGTRLRVLAPDGPTVFYDSGEVFTAGSGNFVSPYDEGCWNIAIADVGYSSSKLQVLVGRAVVFYTDVNAPVANP